MDNIVRTYRRSEMRLFRHGMLALVVLASVLFGCNASTQKSASPPPTDTVQAPVFPDVDAFITGLMALYDIPGASAALVEKGEIVYVQGYGVRSTETGEPVTPDTLFAIGSVTKSFTALDVMQLADQGRIMLDAPVVTYLPDFKLADPDATQRVTVRQLLAQTSGLPGADDAAWYSGQITNLQQAVEYAATLPLAAAPGSIHIYDNFNYAIAGYLIEQVTGQSWEDYTREHILEPLGMTRADFDIQTLQQTPDHALPHRLDILEGMQPRSFVSLAGIASAGALNASAREMADYLQFQLGDGTVNGEPLISTALLNELHTQQVAYPPMPPVGPTGFQTRGYALGWFTAGFNGVSVLWHNGSIDGFYVIVMFIPSENVGVAVLSNAGLGTGSLFALAASLGLLERLGGMDTQRDVVAALNEEAAFDPVDRQTKLEAARSYHADPADWIPLLGEYRGSQGTISVEEQDGRLYLNQPQGPESQRLELFPFGPTDFLAANRSRDGLTITFTFVTTDNGSITLLQDGVQIGQKGSS
jgi:CubicO group peptidase (beta-lactamase class C family)